ncbi:MAG: HAMP domain-containing sensor histidine kinase [Pyrinomonadaceae bacterium]|nr:HAMP domain-containing sensor histidine kinase [Pyrinomonadaceae bacterium]
MKRNWITNIAVAGIVALLTVFLVLQYTWLSEASAAEQERMQRRVESDTKAFADEFNREVQAAYFNFQTGAETFRNADYTEFNERYDFWKSKTAFPELITEILFVPKDDAGTALKYDAAAKTFVPADQPDEISRIRSAIGPERPATFIDAQNLFIIPIFPSEKQVGRILIRTAKPDNPTTVKLPEPEGYVVVKLDRQVLTEKLIPQLASKYFPEGNYRVSVNDSSKVDAAGQPSAAGEPDATAGLFNMTPENLVFFASRELALPRREAPPPGGVVVNQRIETHTFSRAEAGEKGKAGRFTIEVQENDGGTPKTAVLTRSSTEGGQWQLSVSHAAGSIEEFVRGEKYRNTGIALGIYLLLVGSILAIVVSANRARAFAQRQVDFVSSVSHEFRTPLAVIYSAGENLADGVAKDETQVSRYGELIKGEGRKLSSMVEQILEFAGARSGKRKFNFVPAEVSEIVADALKECGPMIKERGVEVETDIAAGLPTIDADRTAISQALQNLIANAVKYGNGERWVRISAANGGGAVRLTVEDRGIGISNADLKKIFEPFYRSKDVVDAQIHGNGLGLSLVKEIAEAHGGKVTAASETGKGSRFTIELPAAKA